jgi:signal peptidase II
LSKYFKNYWSLTIVAGMVIFVDQITKNLVRQNMAFGTEWTPLSWLPLLRIVHWNNTGAAFGMLPSFKDVFMILAVIVAIAILYYYPQVSPDDWPLKLAMGMQCGGAVGNLIDRLLHDGHVTDFISVGNFAVFNVADASISTGVAVLVVWMLYKERQEKRTAITPVEVTPTEAVLPATPEEPASE